MKAINEYSYGVVLDEVLDALDVPEEETPVSMALYAVAASIREFTKMLNEHLNTSNTKEEG